MADTPSQPGSGPGAHAGLATPQTLNVLINLYLEPELVDLIASVDPRVRPVRALVPLEDARFGPGAPTDVGWRPLEGDELAAALADTNVIFGFSFDRDWIERAPTLRWVQLASAGAEHIAQEKLLDGRPDVLMTTSSGVHEIPIAEHILGMLLHFARGFDRALQSQRSHEWKRFTPVESFGKTVLFIGYGAIARRAALLCKSLGMHVLAVRPSISALEPGDGVAERFYPLAMLNDALAESECVVVAAPHTPRSEKMIGREQFGAMKPETIFVNISRGAVVDEPALVDALREGRLRGAGLDVFVEEPLPEDSPLWDMPNVLITPHISGRNPDYSRRATEIFCDNLARFLDGRPLRNLVDWERGY
jgi:phosphoglycerate dehydrogenase-like enzyme